MTVMQAERAFALPDRWKRLVDLGFSAFPVERRGKKPLGKWKAYQAERPDITTVRQWSGRDTNIGVATGAVSGLLVLDLDNAEAIAEAELRGIPDTITVRTGKGQHVYFAHPGGIVGNRAGIFPGADIRGDGGYVVAPGSIHESGTAYEWLNPPGLFQLAPVPDWLMDMLRTPSLVAVEAGKVRKAQPGARNDQLNKSAFRLGQEAASGHVDQGEARAALADAARAAGLDDEETRATLASGLGAGHVTPKRNRDPSEDDIALAFAARHGQTLRFDHNVGAWFEWDGTRWKKDSCHRAFTYARQIGRQRGAAGKANFAGGVEKFARADPVHAVTSEIWDSDPLLLGTPGGTVDLRTGEYAPAKPDNYITKLTGISPEHGEPTRWLQFLEEATAGDHELMRFLQQVAGYCLTGLTNEHALFFIYGPGGNGKSVFLNILNFILGDYATTAGMDTFTASKSDRHPTDLAMLRGARMVSASETEEGRAWAESRIKQMTGGDKISARFMRQDFFEFIPAFKLVIVGNHAPVLANVDEAARRRFNIIPFTHKPASPDRMLEERLKEEAGRILAWAIRGCRDWQANGLVRPEIVTAATAEYFDDQDLFGQWINDRCERSANKFELPTPLYNDWASYARAAGDDPGSQRAMSGRLKRAGFRYGKNNGVRAYYGVSLRPCAGGLP
ncbi:phage/plasmid primase, P4 family, C-terminal domain-containing protein [Sphingobium faniae]|nr:phage/plasmid primase, P4 family, C-terminal domain-containing protein [Sphingobium faniae]